MIHVNMHDAKTNLSKLVTQAQNGETVLICNRNLPVAELRAVSAAHRKPRPIGLYDGLIEIPDDLFAPMTDDEVDGWDRPLP